MDNKKDIDIEELLKKAEAEQSNKDNSQDSNAKEEEKTEDFEVKVKLIKKGQKAFTC